MKKSLMVVAAVGLLALTGCSSKPSPEAEGQYYVQNPKESLAANMQAYAGYPGLISDYRYNSEIDTALTSGTMGMLLPQDLTSVNPLAAGGLGVGLGLLGSLVDTYPIDVGYVVTSPMAATDKYNDTEVVKRAVIENFDLRRDQAEPEAVKELMKVGKIEMLHCEEYHGFLAGDFTHTCFIPGWEKYNFYVHAARPANGTEFPGILDLPKGHYTVLMVRQGNGSILKIKEN